MKESLFKKILYATDLSETAKKAARYALSLAHEYGAELTVVNVIPDLVEEMSAGMGYDLASHFGREKLSSFYGEGLEESKKKWLSVFMPSARKQAVDWKTVQLSRRW